MQSCGTFAAHRTGAQPRAVAGMWKSWTQDACREAADGMDCLGMGDARRFAARVTATIWLSLACAAALALLVPGTEVDDPALVALIAVCAAGAGALLLGPASGRFSLRRAPAWTLVALASVAALAALTGGALSPARALLWLVLVYAALFLSPWQVAVCWAGCSAVHALPLVYDPAGIERNLARELLVIVPSYAVMAFFVVAGRRLLGRLTRDGRRLAAEQASLRRVATAVAAGSPPQATFTLVSVEAGRLLGADGAGILRCVGEEQMEVMGNWCPQGQTRMQPGETFRAGEGDEIARVRDASAPMLCDRVADDGTSQVGDLGYASFVGAPVHVRGATWGVLCAVADRPGAFPAGTETRVLAYAELIATAVANAEDRAQLGAQAAVDALTDLPNERAFRDRLRDETTRARRHGRPLVAAVVDVDRFRALTERVGAAEADAVLADLAALLRAEVDEEDVVARLGTDEFGIAFLERDRAGAQAAAERLRETVAATPLRHGERITVSVGLSDLCSTPADDELLRRADAALLYSKEHGRDRCWFYDATIVHAAVRRTQWRELGRERGLAGLRALARAIDAKHPATHEHSERVATLAARLAGALGWDEERIERLREAARLHDVGKIGVPDGVLLKPGPLDAREAMVMREHVSLGARIVGDVLDPGQVAWIAAHHERPDGRGYPAGALAHQIPEGATLLALADAWDSMVSDRIYSPRRSVEGAMAECRSLVGRQFSAEAVRALEELHERGELDGAAARLHRPAPDRAAA